LRSEFVHEDHPRWFELREVERRLGKRPAHALFAFANGLISIAIMATLAWLSGVMLIFPSLGPTAFLLFYAPLTPAASPRNTLLGHLIGVLCGYAALALFGLTHARSAMVTGIDPAHVGSASLSLAATAGLMVLFAVEHPPAGATTLIVSLGVLRRPSELVALMAAVALLSLQGWVINRLAGIPYPAWRPATPAAGPGPHPPSPAVAAPDRAPSG
jgi:CBS domain-containing membrane protein